MREFFGTFAAYGWRAIGNSREALSRIYFGNLNAAFKQLYKMGRYTLPAEDQA